MINIILLLIIGGVFNQELNQEDAVQFIQDIKNQTLNRLQILEREWKMKSDTKKQIVCLFDDMITTQQNECQSRSIVSNSLEFQIQESIDIIDRSNQRLQKNENKIQQLDNIKCKENVNTIKLMKDQKSMTQLSIQLQRSFAQSNSQSLIEYITNDQLFEQEEQDQILEILEENTELADLTGSQKDKQIEQNKQKIIQVSQSIQKTVPSDIKLLQTNSIKSNRKIDKYIEALKNENEILKGTIKLQSDNQIDLKDKLTMFKENDNECSQQLDQISLLKNLGEQSLQIERENYEKQKQQLLDELDFYSDLLRSYLKQIYKI